MRKIKFRAWNEQAKRYSKPFTLKCSVLNFTDDDGLGVMKSLTDEVVEQFTGLKDKNGVEVYDGDILAFHVDWSEQPNKEVIFDNSFHSYVLLSGEEKEWVAKGSNHFKYWSTDEDNIYLLHEADSYEIEVIGNIHENPELLCAKK